MQDLTICALQLDLAWEQPEKNRKHIEQLLDSQSSSVDLIVLPEMFSTGFSMDADRLAEEMNGPTVNWLKNLSSTYKTHICGSLIIKEAGKFYNRLLCFDNGELKGQYDKKHLFRMGKEDRVYTAGEELPIFDIKGWKVMPQICYDLRFPVYTRNQTDEEGNWRYDLVLYIASWPQKRVQHWETLLQARAIENQSFVVGVNRVGVDGNGLAYTGSSMVVHPSGKRLAFAQVGEAIFSLSLKAEDLAFNRRAFPFWKDADPFTLN